MNKPPDAAPHPVGHAGELKAAAGYSEKSHHDGLTAAGPPDLSLIV